MYSMNIGAFVPSLTVKILDVMDVVIPSDHFHDCLLSMPTSGEMEV